MVSLIPVPGFLYFNFSEIRSHYALEFLHRELANAKVIPSRNK